MIRPISILTLFLTLVIFAAAAAKPPRISAELRGKAAAKTSGTDLQSYFDANNLLMFVTNIGSVGMDQTMLFGRTEGFYYPYSGNPDSLDNRTVVYSAGIMLSGKVGGTIRTAVAAYESPEFAPGPISGGTFIPDQPSFRVYRIDRSSGPGDPDYDNWPVSDGAPVGQDNLPLLMGDQTLWAVYNDADTSRHGNYFGGGTDPLGVEIRQTVWGENTADEENLLYIKYKLYNRGDNVVDSFYITFWADPDIGGPNDDLVGCDTGYDLFYCYNGDNYDASYDYISPAWGGKIVSGPVVPSPGDTASFDGNPLPDFRNISSTSIISYVNGTEPSTPQELFLYSSGLDAFTGQPFIDPTSGDTATHFAPGNPLRLSGWVDRDRSDKRLMVNFGPLTFNPGDSQQVIIRIGAYAEKDRLFSLSVLRHLLDNNIPVDSVIDTVTYIASDSVQVFIDDFGLERISFSPLKERWLTGFDWGGDHFNGGADFSYEFFGSALDPAVYPDSFHSAEIRFSRTTTQKAYRYIRGGENYYEYGGYYEVPFTAWDLDNDRQLNAAFVEHYGSEAYDSTWGPADGDQFGNYEFLFLFNSDYSGEDSLNSIMDYTSINILENADSLDLLYFIWPVIREEGSLDDLSDGQKISILGQFLNSNGLVDSILYPSCKIGSFAGQAVSIRCFSEGPAEMILTTSDETAFVPTTGSLRFRDSLDQRIAIDFYPYRAGRYEEVLYFTDAVSGELKDSIKLIGSSPEALDVDDSEDNDPDIIPSSFTLHQNYPNPFNPATTIGFSLPMRSAVKLTVYNLLGRRVRLLADRTLNAGQHEIIWNGDNAAGEPVASGVYFYRLEAGEFIASKKMVLIR